MDSDEVNADLDRIYEHMEEKLRVYFGLTEEQARSLSSMSEEGDSAFAGGDKR